MHWRSCSGVVTMVTASRGGSRCCSGGGSTLRSAGETAHETARAARSGASCGRHIVLVLVLDSVRSIDF